MRQLRRSGRSGFQPRAGRSILAPLEPPIAGDSHMENIARAALLMAACTTSALACCTAWAQDTKAEKPVTVIAGLSNLHHPVSTTNPEAQQFFDQGLRLVYAFN